MGRIIIDNRSSLVDYDAVQRVAYHMVEPPQVGGRAYLAAALYTDDIVVTHDENKASHKFTLFNKQPKGEK